MLIQGKLPITYTQDAQFVEKYYDGHDNNSSVHFWIDKIHDKSLKLKLDKLRSANEILLQIQKAYPSHKIVPVQSSDEIYISVDPSKRKNSDIALSDCHYDAPFKYVPQCGNVFVRVILSLTENTTTYTTIGDKTSLLDRLDFNGMDYNNDYHCVKGYIPDGSVRILLKLHFLCIDKNSSSACATFTQNLNNKWTHISRDAMRFSSQPKNVFQLILGATIVLLSKIYNNSRAIILICLLLVASMYIKNPSDIALHTKHALL